MHFDEYQMEALNTAIASDLDLSLNEIAEGNVTKLKDRQERGVLKGNGDNR